MKYSHLFSLLFCCVINIDVVTSYDFEEEYTSDYIRRFYQVSTTEDQSKSSTTESTSTDQIKERWFDNQAQTKHKLSLKILDEVKDALKEIFQDREDVDTNVIEDITKSLASVKQSSQRSIRKYTTRKKIYNRFFNVPTRSNGQDPIKTKIKPTRSKSHPKNVITESLKIIYHPSRPKNHPYDSKMHKTNKQRIRQSHHATRSYGMRRFGWISKNRTKLKHSRTQGFTVTILKKDGKRIGVLRQNYKSNDNEGNGDGINQIGDQGSKYDGNTERLQDVSESTDLTGDQGNQELTWVVTILQEDYQGSSLIDDQKGGLIVDQSGNQIEDQDTNKGRDFDSLSKNYIQGLETEQSDLDSGRAGNKIGYQVVYQIVNQEGEPNNQEEGGGQTVIQIVDQGSQVVNQREEQSGEIVDQSLDQNKVNQEGDQRGYKEDQTNRQTVNLIIDQNELFLNQDPSNIQENGDFIPRQHDDPTTTTDSSTQTGTASWPPAVWSGTFDFEAPTTTTKRTTPPPKLDLAALLDIIANLTYDYETNLTHFVNETLQKWSVPTCGTPTTVTTTEPTTTEVGYDYWENGTGTVMGKCFVCGLQEQGIPYYGYCGDAFGTDFIPLTPVNPVSRGQIGRYRKYCRYMDIVGSYVNESDPKTVWGRWTGGCGVRWIDLTSIYSQRTCRNRLRATLGKHYLSKRMAKLEMALQHVEDGCVISPVASLVPMSRGINLYGRFHACVCSKAWCNSAVKVASDILAVVAVVDLVIAFSFKL